ncbi:MAG: NAD-dependent succinate-semialdehyde dehydrogenase [Magnetovibrio sp.]|nr:NAD-dependent succinate-semialdehyde dehydrogenase [Magnetovibrio sp.]
MKLSDTALLRQSAYIDGAWVNADTGETFDVINPASLAKIAQVPKMGALETRRAIEAADKALPAWRSKTAKDRAKILKKWFELVMAASDDLATLMTAEQGKPLAEAKGEVVYGASFIEWFGEEAKRLYGDTIPAPAADRRLIVIKEPIGVVASITPWNFPLAMITRKCAPAMAAGCSVVAKPAEDTPLSALALAELADRAGIPKGVFNVVTGDPVEIGAEMTSNPIVRKVSFTGSTRVGKMLMRQCSDTLKKVSLELGGNAPFIVFDDADVDAAVQGAMASKFRNTGQTCVCANRIYVQDSLYDSFVEKMTAAVKTLKVGDGFEDGVSQGPLINQAAIEKVERLVKDAVSKGATVVTGGNRHELGGTFYEPTLLTNVTSEMACTNEEIFCPVATLYRFANEADVIAQANDTRYGLASYFYARDIGRVWRVAEALEYGMVSINEGVVSTELAPFGGIKESGLGREGGAHGIDEFVEIKYLCMGGL